jgi:hypothetical protein
MAAMIAVLFFNCQNNKRASNSESVKIIAKEKLQYALRNSTGWEKVHAAEYILNLDHSNNVYDTFLKEEEQNRNKPYYRIGIWRVLNQAAVTTTEKNKWLDSISKVYVENTSLDRIHAAESLAKLKVSPSTISIGITDSILKASHDPLWAYTYWGTAYDSEKDMREVKNKFVDIIIDSNEQTQIKRIALYALYKMRNIDVHNWDLLISRALDETRNSPLNTNLLLCTLANIPRDSLGSSRVRECREKLESKINSLNSDELPPTLAVYEYIATEEDLPFLRFYMDKGDDLNNREIIMAAANAILSID